MPGKSTMPQTESKWPLSVEHSKWPLRTRATRRKESTLLWPLILALTEETSKNRVHSRAFFSPLRQARPDKDSFEVVVSARRGSLNTHRTRNYAGAERSAFTLAVVTFLLMFVGLPRLRADDERTKCQRRIEKAEARYEDAVRDHGWQSHEAEERREALHRERERCYERFHQWWDGREQRWHDDKDWDRDDRDERDRDHS